MKKIIVLLSACMAFMFIGCGTKNSPAGIVNGYFEATQAQDYETALTYTNLSEEDAAAWIEQIEGLGMVIHEFAVTNSTIDEGDTTATVNTHVLWSSAFNIDTVESEIPTVCHKIDGKWKIIQY